MIKSIEKIIEEVEKLLEDEEMKKYAEEAEG
jgi:hypothetical protein